MEMKKVPQWSLLHRLLSDMKPHRTDEIVDVVYGPGLSLSRVAARIFDVKKFLPDYQEILSWKDKERPSLHWYQLRDRQPVDPNEHYSLFGGGVGEIE